MVCELSRLLPTFVFGDPLQAVFGFAGIADWETDVARQFPLVERLDHPWRWERAGAGALGAWLIDARERLNNGVGIDLEQLPPGCEWRPLSGDARRDAPVIRTATSYWQREAGTVLVLANPMNPRRHADMARNGEGIQVVENLDLTDVFQRVSRLDLAAEEERLRPLLDLADSVMTGMGVTQLFDRCDVLTRGRARTPPNADETTALAFRDNPSWAQAREALSVWSTQPGRRVFRRDVLRLLLDSLHSVASGRHASLGAAAAAARERRRHQGRATSARSIGSTLLLKGLEADYTVLLDVENLSPADLYVAMTRGSRGMLVLSQERWLARAQEH
jgi:DNA helicase-2/ATP-dependent DNA helicase PcrA